MVVLGIVLMLQPGAAMDIACIVIGCGLIITGAIGLLISFVKRKKDGEDIGKNNIITIIKSVAIIVVGVLLIAKTRTVVSILPFIMGVLIIANSAVNILQAILNRKQSGKWVISLVVGLITAIIGIFMVFDPFDAAVSQIFIMGLGLSVGGISNLVNGLTVRK